MATFNGMNFTLDDFCYKPISGEGCLVESPMQYWQNDLDTLLACPADQIKEVAQCIPDPDE